MAESPAGIQHVQALLKADMAAFKPKFRQAVTTDVALLDTVMRYILRQKGKQMRPMFASWLAGERYSGRRDSICPLLAVHHGRLSISPIPAVS